MYNPELGYTLVQIVSRPKSSSDPAMEEFGSDLDEHVDSLGAPGSPSIMSRLSVQKIHLVVSRFSDFKQSSVKEIGFHGALEIQPSQKLNLRLSAWLLDRVDVDKCTLNIEGQAPIGIYDQDVERIISLPCRKPTIGSEGVEPADACIEYTRFAASFSDKGTHSLKAAEAYILREIKEESRRRSRCGCGCARLKAACSSSYESPLSIILPMERVSFGCTILFLALEDY